VARTRCEEYKKKQRVEPKTVPNWAHPLIPICTIFLHVGWPLHMFLKFEFQNDRSRNFGAVGGRSSPIPIDKAHRLYNSLLLPHKPWSSWLLINCSGVCGFEVQRGSGQVHQQLSSPPSPTPLWKNSRRIFTIRTDPTGQLGRSGPLDPPASYAAD